MAAPGTQRGDRPDLLTAGLFIGIGMLGLVMSRHLDFGSLARGGAGCLRGDGCLLPVAVRLIVGIPALRRPAHAIEAVRARPLVVITVAIVGFAFAVTHFGFVAASLWLVITGSLADPGGRWRTVLLLAAGLTAFGALVFVKTLGVQVPLWPL